MMKNLRKNLIVSLVMVLAITLFFMKGVNASGLSIMGGTNGVSENTTSLEENAVTQNATTQNTTTLNTTTLNTTATNVVKVNTVSDGEKDLPQTGENDIYMITAIGAAAIVIGGVAYIKSRKYDIR